MGINGLGKYVEVEAGFKVRKNLSEVAQRRNFTKIFCEKALKFKEILDLNETKSELKLVVDGNSLLYYLYFTRGNLMWALGGEYSE